MSSSTIPTKVRPGQQTMERVAARRAAMLASRSSLVEQFCGEDDGELDRLRARIDASTPVASARELAQARSALERAESDTSVEEARSAVDRLEAESDRRWTDVVERESLLEELAERAGVRIREGSSELQADGRLTAAVEAPGEGTSPVSVSGSRAAGSADGTSILWEVSRSDIRGDGTQEGACEAQEQMVKKVVERFGPGMSMGEQREEQEPTSQPQSVNRRA